MDTFDEWAAENDDYGGRCYRADLREAARDGWNAALESAAKLLEDEGFVGNTPSLIRDLGATS